MVLYPYDSDRGYTDTVLDTLICLRACHTLPMYLVGTKLERKINNGEKIGGAPSIALEKPSTVTPSRFDSPEHKFLTGHTGVSR